MAYPFLYRENAFLLLTSEVERGDFRITLNCVLVAVGICQLLTVLMTSLQTSVVSFDAESGKGEQLLATRVALTSLQKRMLGKVFPTDAVSPCCALASKGENDFLLQASCSACELPEVTFM